MVYDPRRIESITWGRHKDGRESIGGKSRKLDNHILILTQKAKIESRKCRKTKV